MVHARTVPSPQSASEVVTGVCPKWFDATRATPSARKDPSYICVSANLASSPPHESVVRAALSGTLQLRETEVKQVSLTQHTADATKLRASCAILCDDETKCSSVFKKLQQVEAKVWMALSSLPIDLEHPDIKVQMTSNKTLVFGEMSDLYGGIDQLVGPRADGDVAAAVKKEHTECADSDETFTTSNYKVETTSRTEVSVLHAAFPFPHKARSDVHLPLIRNCVCGRACDVWNITCVLMLLACTHAPLPGAWYRLWIPVFGFFRSRVCLRAVRVRPLGERRAATMARRAMPYDGAGQEAQAQAAVEDQGRDGKDQ
eukprot:2290536-Pleurochrysis_carterae.AAC.1